MKKSELLKKIPKKIQKHTARLVNACGKRVLVTCGAYEQFYIYHFDWDTGWSTYYTPKKGSKDITGFWTRENFYKTTITVTEGNEAVERFTKSKYAYSGYLDSAINEYEERIMYSRIKRQHERQQKVIAELMTDTPPLPGGFTNYCKEIRKHGHRVNLMLFQPLECGEKIQRMFLIDDMSNGETGITEICRAYTDDYGSSWNAWYYGQKYYCFGRRQTFQYKKYNSVVHILPRKYFVFPNLDKLTISKEKKDCLRIMDGLMDPCDLIQMVNDTPNTEKLIKNGFTRIVAETGSMYTINARAKDISRLPRQQALRAAKLNVSCDALNVLYSFPKITDKNIKTINKIKSDYKSSQLVDLMSKGLNLNHVMTLLEKTGGLTEKNMRLYSDYIDMAGTLHMDIFDEIVYRNKRWHEFHDQYSERLNAERERREAELNFKRAKEKKEKFKGIETDILRNKRIFSWENDKYRIIVPESYKDIIDEGTKQHHCVGATDTYMLRMATRESWIVFLRTKDNPETPYYTIELDKSRIRQAYSAYDRKPDYEIVEKILNKWMKSVKKNFAKVEKEETAGQKALAAAG